MTGRWRRAPAQRINGTARRADGRLLELIKQFRRCRDRMEILARVQERHDYRSAEFAAADHEIAALVNRSWSIRYAVTELPARSAQGITAKAWLALWELSDGGMEEMPESDDFAVGWSLALDVLGRTA